ncbi:MAG TPA: galactokinase family protein [Acidimicrobiales bacterium]|nr:galactokinase family protein [Acidimicrobiales bacterium]
MRAYSPGRVNLIGDHTDYNEGLALPMAVDLGTTVTIAVQRGSRLVLSSDAEPAKADVDVYSRFDELLLRSVEPHWARYVAAVAALVRPLRGGQGHVETTLPIGAGLSSSASLEVALALALGLDEDPLTTATLCQRAEQAATGVPSGLMDQLVVCAAKEGCASLIDFSDCSVRQLRLPEGAEVVVVHSGQPRTLDSSPYAARRAECEAAAYGMGPLGHLSERDLVGISDPLLRRRARHVVSECDRVRQFCSALVSDDLAEAGALMNASHRSLAVDFDVSTAALDALVEHLSSLRGVFGARLTGAGFGGCAVALTEPGALDLDAFGTPAWRVRPCYGARLLPPG